MNGLSIRLLISLAGGLGLPAPASADPAPALVMASWQAEHPVLVALGQGLTLGYWPVQLGADAVARPDERPNQGIPAGAWPAIQTHATASGRRALAGGAGLVVVLAILMGWLREESS